MPEGALPDDYKGCNSPQLVHCSKFGEFKIGMTLALFNPSHSNGNVSEKIETGDGWKWHGRRAHH